MVGGREAQGLSWWNFGVWCGVIFDQSHAATKQREYEKGFMGKDYVDRYNRQEKFCIAVDGILGIGGRAVLQGLSAILVKASDQVDCLLVRVKQYDPKARWNVNAY